MSEAIIIGGGGHARVLRELLRRRGDYVLGYSAPKPEKHSDLPYLGSDDALRTFATDRPVIAALGVGKIRATRNRIAILDFIESLGITCPPIVAPTATVHSNVELGAATVVLDAAVIITGSRLGRACIVNTGAIIDHDCQIGDDVHLSVGSVICGGATIGKHCMIGAGATIVQSISICDECTIGAGATVTSSIDVPGTYVGTPARKIEV